MRVLELGNYVVPAYAGMILAEQGNSVEKWTNGRDPILGNHRGDELWQWINHGKQVLDIRPRELAGDLFWESRPLNDLPEVIIDNFRPSTLAKWGIDPAKIAAQRGIPWVSMRSEVGEVSFDIVAQARSWMYFAGWVPFWIGDTAGGLWLAFKALAVKQKNLTGHFVLGQASLMQKLVEGELIVDAPRGRDFVPWETEEYRARDGAAHVQYKGTKYVEPARDREWKLRHLWHDGGRIRV